MNALTSVKNPDEVIQSAQDYVLNNPVLKNDLLKSREIYQEATGKIKESYPDFENRINAFLYWYLFNSDISDPPFNKYLASLADKQEKEDFTSLCKHEYSIFEFLKSKETFAVVYDLFSKKKYRVSNPSQLIGIEKGSVFESRVFDFKGEKFLAGYIIEHPYSKKRFIIKLLKSIRKTPENLEPLIMDFENMQHRWRTYKKFELDKIYNRENIRHAKLPE